MKKKSLITMFLSLALVAIIGTGATLAYLSADSNEVKNTFTVGTGYDDEESLYLDELDLVTAAIDDRTMTGNDYTEILPGDTLSKDPTVHFTVGPDSYIFVKVTGMSEATINTPAEDVFTYLNNTLGSAATTTGAWEKIDGTPGLNGIYVYHVGSNYKVEASIALEDALVPLFTGVKLNGNVNVAQFNALKDNGIVKGISDIIIKAAAVQFDNVTATDTKTAVQVAYDLVSGLLNN